MAVPLRDKGTLNTRGLYMPIRGLSNNFFGAFSWLPCEAQQQYVLVLGIFKLPAEATLGNSAGSAYKLTELHRGATNQNRHPREQRL